VNVFEMVVIIVIVSVLGSVLSGWLKHRNKAGTRLDEQRLERLEERVRVLERIVTDSGYDLRRQFHDLERDA
jgi:hypothetical protein